MNLKSLVEHHYEEHLPCESESMKECEARAQQTLSRIEKMKWNALLQGYDIKFNSRYYIDQAQKHFEQPKIIEKEGIPRLKFSYLKTLIKKIINE